MGFFGDVANRIRDYFRRDKEQVGLELAKGATASGYPTSGYDLLQAYGYDVLSDFLKLEHDLLSRYIDYEEMDDYPEVAAAIDIYADDASQPETHLSRTLWVTSKDETIANMLDDLFHRQLRMDEEIWEIARTVTKYGNDFEEILVTQDGVRGLNFLAPPTVRRIEGPRGELFGFVQDFKGRFGYCLARGSRVWSDRGLVEIQNFERGAVLGYVDGQARLLPVKQKHVSGTKRVFRVKTQHREVFVTEDHPMLAQVGDGPVEWTKVKDLKIVRYNGKKRNIDYSRSSKLVISTRMPQGEVPTWESIWTENPFDVAWGNKGSPVQLSLPERPTEDFCRLFGFLLGDGWFGAAETDTRVYFARGVYPELNDKYDALLRQLGLNVEVKPVVSDGEVTGEMSVASSVQFKRLMSALGWIPGFDHKRVPGWVYALPEEHREAFLRGFLDADGWMNSQPGRRPRHFFEVANYDLTRDFKNLIDGLGYVCGNLYKRTRKPGTVVKGKTIKTQQTCYGLSFTDEKFEKPFVVENVLKISYYEDAEVFDLEVDDSAHNFVADGLVVHNSPAEFQQIMANRAAMRQGGSEKAGFGGMEKISALEDWEVVHFRLRGKHRRSIYGYCLSGSSRVWTPRGIKEIRDLRAGDRVFTRHAGRLLTTLVLDQVCSGTKPVYRLRTPHREVRLTAEHPVLVERGGKNNVWVPAGEVKLGERIVIAASMPALNAPPALGLHLRTLTDATAVRLTVRGAAALRTVSRATCYAPRDEGLRATAQRQGITRGQLEELLDGKSSLSFVEARTLFDAVGVPFFEGAVEVKPQDDRLSLPDFMEPWFARLWGFLVGDGWLTDGQVCFALGTDEDRNKFYEGLLARTGVPVGRLKDEHGVERQAFVSSTALVDLMRKLGWTDGAHNKRLPSWIFCLDEDFRRCFLDGFLDADGWSTYEDRYQHTEICNEELLRDLKNLIDGLGWTSGHIRSRDARDSTLKSGKVIHSGEQFTLTYHDTPLADGAEFTSEEVLSFDLIGEEPVYDVQVANSGHNFIADGVVVHNSVLEPARWIWKRLMLLEDAALIYRLQRAPERYAFYVDVGDLPPQEAFAYINRIRQTQKKKKWVNPTTGKLDVKFDPISQDEDFFIPVREGKEGTRIEVLGAPSWQHMEDVEYFRDKLFAAIKVPKAYLAQTEGISRNILSSEDVRFARTVLRVQREMRNGLSKVARVHLAALNIDPQRVDYNIHLTVPSAIFELAQLEVKNARADLANRMREFVSLHWIMSNIFGMSDEEIQTIFRERDEDAERDAYTQANAQSIIGKAIAAAGIEGQAQGQVDASTITQTETPPDQLKAAADLQKAAVAGTSKKQESNVRGPLIRIKGSEKRTYYDRERVLFEGANKDSERRAQEKLDKLLRSDRATAARLTELGAMLRELNHAVGDSRRR